MNPIEELRYLILAIQREGNRLLAADLRPLEVSPSQAEVLRVLAEHAPLTLQGLGDLLVCERGSPSRLVDRMVESGLVDRDTHPDDRRQIALTLTPKGREKVDQIVTVEERLYEHLEGLTRGAPLQPALLLLRQVADAFPAGHALARRKDCTERSS